MVIRFVIDVAVAVVAFGLGRIKNAGKLAEIKAYVESVKAAASVDVGKIVVDIKAKL